MIILYLCLYGNGPLLSGMFSENKRRLAASGQQIMVSDSSMLWGAPGRCLFCKFSQKNEKVCIKSQASTYNLDILAVCFLAGQSTFHHCKAMETDGNCQRVNISWHYYITYYQCAACIVSHHETSFSGWLIPTKAWRQLAKGSHTTSLTRANHACDKKHRLGSTNSQ